ncbi:MAG TPA: hypothetical protein VHA76_07990 [Solirubrobacterales bacterium]|nr:hypothetical protein [Solirubrobacterales bacterium]
MFRARDLDSSPPRRLRVSRLRNGSYITDGRRLFRCILGERGPMLMLEDCRTLELILCSFADLADSQMRIVRAAA